MISTQLASKPPGNDTKKITYALGQTVNRNDALPLTHIIFFVSLLAKLCLILGTVITAMAGRPRNVSHIVPPKSILTEQQMSLERLGPFELRVMLQDDRKMQIEWLAQRALLRNTRLCTQCFGQCTLVAAHDSNDGYLWRCHLCGKNYSIRKDSWFHSPVPLGKLMWLLFSWATEVPTRNMMWHLEIAAHTAIDWVNFIRNVCVEDTCRHPMPLGGFDASGAPIIVEIDESYFNDGVWVFGAIERKSGLCRMDVVPDRRAATLQPLIQQWMLPGTHIISDSWAAYHHIDQLNGGVYLHDVVVHEQNFVDPIHADIHTQNVRNMWMRVKRKLRHQFGTTGALFPTYLGEFVWHECHKGHDQRLSALLLCIREQYP